MFKKNGGLIPPTKPAPTKLSIPVPPLREPMLDASGREYYIPSKKTEDTTTSAPDSDPAPAPK